MSLYGSIKTVQSTTKKFYLNLEQHFNGNKIISELWSHMAQDVSQQMTSLLALPKSFWPHFKKDQNRLLETITAEIKPQNIENVIDLSLSDCIEKAIHAEETIILKIYVPIIRNLRKNWTGQALDFYIMVKAHIVRIKRMAEAFSGDPVVLQHSARLFQTFEKEIQEPEVEIVIKKKPARRGAGSNKAEKPRPEKQTKSAAKPKKEAKKKPAAASKPKSQAKKKSAASAKPKKPLKTASTPKKTTKQSKSLANRSKVRRNRSATRMEKAPLRRSRSRG